MALLWAPFHGESLLLGNDAGYAVFDTDTDEQLELIRQWQALASLQMKTIPLGGCMSEAVFVSREMVVTRG